MSSQNSSPPTATGKDAWQETHEPVDIDRRQCHRVVPMEVLCFGLSRTGTASMRQALFQLGYNDTYHYKAVFGENPRDAEMWNDALDAKFKGKGKLFGKAEWDQLLGHCMAVTDTPCHLFWHELVEAYPDAKVILTERDSAEQWEASIEQTIKAAFFDEWYHNVGLYRRLLHFFVPVSRMMLRFEQLLFETPFWQDIMHKKGKEYYKTHNAAIKEAISKDNLLVFNVKEGWQPLCTFLGKEVPNCDFPKTNERGAFRELFFGYSHYLEQVAETRLRWTITGFLGLAAAGGVFWTRYLRPRA